MKLKNRPVIAGLLCAILFLHTASVGQVRAEDLLRWQIITPEGVSLGVVEGLASVYTNRVIYYDPFGVSPNRCVNGCTFVLDSYQNVQGTTTTIAGAPPSQSSSTTSIPRDSSSTGPLTGWTLRIAQLSQNQMQINGCLDNTGSNSPLTINASWTISQNGVLLDSGSGTAGLLLSSSSNPACPTEFLANFSGLTASTEYVVTYIGGIPGNIVTGSRAIITSNAPATIPITPTTSASSITNEPLTTAVANGEVQASIGGVEVGADTTVKGNAVTVNVGDVTAEISGATTPGQSTNTQAEQGLVLAAGEIAGVSIDGLQPNSEMEVVIYSTPRQLGTLLVNEFGELVASIQIPSDMEAGPHTLVLTGLDKFGKQIELKFGLVVYSPDSYIPIWVWLVVGILAISLTASLVSRKSKKVVITT
jgi:hypothetical protein